VANAFSASDSALGYLYQSRVALFGALQRIRYSPDLEVKIECLDDVTFEVGRDPLEQLQSKHSLTHAGIGDMSPDLWKTLRVWCEVPETVQGTGPLYLWSTATASPTSAAALLSQNVQTRDAVAARLRLLAAATDSKNEALEKAFAAFVGLGAEKQLTLLNRVVVLDGAPHVVDLTETLEHEVALSVARPMIKPFLDRLEGWWHQRAVLHLADPSTYQLTGDDLFNKLDELRDQLREDNLPIDLELEAPDIPQGIQQAVFVQQLGLAKVVGVRVERAVREYLRAYAQRSRWQRDGLLRVGEVDRYERRLVAEWEVRFQEIAEDLGADAAEEAKIKAARALYRWVEQECEERIRPDCGEAFVVRGSYHHLSDRKAVGWHLDFESRLLELLDASSASGNA
jgi:hypothetical protein